MVVCQETLLLGFALLTLSYRTGLGRQFNSPPPYGNGPTENADISGNLPSSFNAAQLHQGLLGTRIPSGPLIWQSLRQ